MEDVLDRLASVARHIGDDLVAVVPPPSTLALLVTLAIGVIAVAWAPAWRRTRHVVTIVHEGGHAAVALLSGRRLQGIRLHSDTSGLTVSRGKPSGPGMIATAAAGYPAPAIGGLIAALLLADGRAAAALWATVLVLALMLLVIRNFFGLWVLLIAAAAVVGVTWWGSAELKLIAAHAVAWVLLLGAPRAVIELAQERRRTLRSAAAARTDADQLAHLTVLPATVWVATFLALTVGAAALGIWALTAHLR